MDENNNQENLNKTPRKMSRLAWPKAIYGVVLAVIIIILIISVVQVLVPFTYIAI